MNPAIHHPAWYNLVSILSQSEFEESLRKPIIATPQMAQYVSMGFSVLCLPDRWQATCEAKDGSRIIELAKATFDKLYHTPVTAYGVNHGFHVETTKQISSTLATLVRQTALPFPTDEEGTGTITYTARAKDCSFQTVVAASPRGANFLHIQNNAHFPLSSGEVTQVDLGPLIEGAYQRNEDRSRLMLSRLVTAIEELK